MLVQALEGAQSPGAVDRGGDVVLGVISAGKGGTASVPSDAFSFFFVRRRKNGTGRSPSLPVSRFKCAFVRHLDQLRRVGRFALRLSSRSGPGSAESASLSGDEPVAANGNNPCGALATGFGRKRVRGQRRVPVKFRI